MSGRTRPSARLELVREDLERAEVSASPTAAPRQLHDVFNKARVIDPSIPKLTPAGLRNLLAPNSLRKPKGPAPAPTPTPA